MTPLTLLFILTFLVAVDIRILAPVLPSISASLGSSPGTIGLAMTTYSLAYGTGQLFYGPLSDRLGRIAVIRAAGVGFSICTILSALSVTAWHFILVRLLAGALAGAVIPLTLVFIGDTVEYERRQAVLGQLCRDHLNRLGVLRVDRRHRFALRLVAVHAVRICIVGADPAWPPVEARSPQFG